VKLEPRVLTGRFVRLEPFAPALESEVRRALDVDPEGWAIMSTAADGPRFDGWWTQALAEAAAGRRIPFAVRRLDTGDVVGTTSLLEIRALHRSVEIGATFLRPDQRSSPVNPDCKRLLLAYAFEAGAVRVELVVDTRNQRSQAAVMKLGAVKEGVLRKHKTTWTGFVRDTAVFSITDDEWPGVRAGLDARLAALEADCAITPVS
jgi:RimJ/RimL family protein N-acetyltransferase